MKGTKLQLLVMLVMGIAADSGALEFALTNANIVDVRNKVVLVDQTIVTRGNRIAWVGPTQDYTGTLPEALFDASGAYVVAGLVDSHTHVVDKADLAMYLSAGVTSIVDLGGPDHRSMRDEIDLGSLVGPSLYTCGPTLTSADESQVQHDVDLHAEAGFDCIKIYDEMSAEVFRAISVQGKESGLFVAAHIPRNLGWSDMLDAAPGAVAHAEEFLYSPCCSAEEFEKLESQMLNENISLITTMTTYDNITQQVLDSEMFLSQHPTQYLSPIELRKWTPPLNRYSDWDSIQLEKMRRLLAFQQYLVGRLSTHGVNIVLGTDSGNTGTFPGASVADELELLVKSGLSTYEALATATINAGKFIGPEERIGVIESGAIADLLVLYADPTNDISNIRFVRGVMSRGQWFDEDSLKVLRSSASLAHEAERSLVMKVESAGVTEAMRWVTEMGLALDTRVLNELGHQLMHIQNEPVLALSVFKANVDINPADWVAHASYFKANLSAGDSSLADYHYDEARRLAAGDPYILNRLAKMRQQLP